MKQRICPGPDVVVSAGETLGSLGSSHGPEQEGGLLVVSGKRRQTMRKIIIASLIMGSAVTLGGCARNYAGEGAAVGAAVGAGIGAATGGDIATGAAIGGAVGAAGGSQIRKRDNRCYQVDRYGREYEVRC